MLKASVSVQLFSFCHGFLQISSSAESEAKTSTGLVKGHAYSITGMEEVRAKTQPKFNVLG